MGTVPTRDAATVVLLRSPAAGAAAEVLLLRRHARSGFAASAWVFPGGVVDDGDAALARAGLDDAAVVRLGRVTGRPGELAAALAVTGIRETFEEAGVLLADRADGTPLHAADPDVAMLRHALGERGTRRSAHVPETGMRGLDLGAWLRDRGVRLALDRLVPLARWVTPAQEPKRYDTLFFVARTDAGQAADADLTETTAARWSTAAQALEAHAAGDLHLIYPTVKTLEWLADHPDAQDALSSAAAQPRLQSVQPHLLVDDVGRYTGVVHPDDPAFPWEEYPELAAARDGAA